MQTKNIIITLAAAGLAVAGPLHSLHDDPISEVMATHNAVNEFDLEEAFKCIDDWCNHNKVRPDGKIRCVRGSAIVYMCNYGNENPCNGNEMRTARQVLKENSGRKDNTGWVYYQDWAKTYGFDAWCPRGDCDLKFQDKGKTGNPGEACPNVKNVEWQYSSIQERNEAPAEEKEAAPSKAEWKPHPTQTNDIQPAPSKERLPRPGYEKVDD